MSKTFQILLLCLLGFDAVDDLLWLVPRPGSPFESSSPEVCALPAQGEWAGDWKASRERLDLDLAGAPRIVSLSAPRNVLNQREPPLRESGADLRYRLQNLLR